MSEEKYVYVLVGGPTGDYPGSRRYSCEFCKAEIWLAPAGQQIVLEGHLPCCLPCGLERIEPDNFGIRAETLLEMQGWLKRN